MYSNLLTTHKIAVTLFLLLYLVKTMLLLANSKNALAKVSKIMRIPEMIISTLFLATGIALWTQTANNGSWLIIKVLMVAASIPLAIVGFKKENKVLALVSLLLIVASYGFSEMSKAKFRKAGAEKTANVTDGKTLFEARCVSCHGSDGRLGLSGASDLSVSSLDLPEKTGVITNGRNTMMGYGNQLTPEQINALAAYVESLKK